MEFQADISEPTGDRSPHRLGLAFICAMDHRVICKTLEPDSREFPRHPSVETVMQK
jgi:hypothetical protein